MQFQVGEQYSAAETQRDLEVGNAGGIRVSMNRNEVKRVVLLTAAPSAKIRRENPYHDRVEGDVLVYSAGGLSGDQTLGGFNRRLSEQGDARFPIYGFRLNGSRRKTEARRWEFLGLLQVLRWYPNNHIDRDSALRKTWLFELRICSEFPQVRLAETGEEIAPDTGTRENAASIEAARAQIFSLDPRGFEFLVKKTMEASGFVNVSVTRYTQDNGIDVNAQVSQTNWPIAGMRVQVQAKRWLHTVGRREVAELWGSLEPFAQGAVVTTSFFSRSALVEAKTPGRQPIVLVDGYHFALTVKSHGLLAS